MGKPINVEVVTIVCYPQYDQAAGPAVSAPVAHGGDPQYRAVLSVERTFRPKRGSAREAGAMLAQLLCLR